MKNRICQFSPALILGVFLIGGGQTQKQIDTESVAESRESYAYGYSGEEGEGGHDRDKSEHS